MKIALAKINNFNWLIANYFIFSYIYIYWISIHYDYYGFVRSSSFESVLLSFCALILVSLYITYIINTNFMGKFSLCLLILIYFFPQLILNAFALNNLSYFLFVLIYLMELLVFDLLIKDTETVFRIKGKKIELFDFSIIILAILMIGISGYYSGYRISFSLSDFYKFRAQVRMLSLPIIFSYMLPWIKQFLPIGLIYSLVYRKRKLSGLLMLTQILCFSFDGKKSSLFIFGLALMTYFFYKREYKKKLPYFFSIFGLVSILEIMLRDGASFIANFVIRRMFFLPPLLGSYYFDFFNHNELLYLRSSFLRWFGFSSPYSEEIPQLIGRIYYGSSFVNANTGLCGDAFSNFGWFSLLIYPLMNICFFKILTKYGNGIDERIQFIICVVVVYTFISGSFFSILLTNGLLLLVLLMQFLPKN